MKKKHNITNIDTLYRLWNQIRITTTLDRQYLGTEGKKIIDTRTGWHLKDCDGSIRWLSPDFAVVRCTLCVETRIRVTSPFWNDKEECITKLVECKPQKVYDPSTKLWLKIKLTNPAESHDEFFIYSDGSMFYHGGANIALVNEIVKHAIIDIDLIVALRERTGKQWTI